MRVGQQSEVSAAPPTGWQHQDMDEAEHFVQFYETERCLLESVSGFIGAALARGDAGLVLATPSHRAALEQRLQADGLDLTEAAAESRYLAVDAGELLAATMVDGEPAAERFGSAVGALIARAT